MAQLECQQAHRAASRDLQADRTAAAVPAHQPGDAVARHVSAACIVCAGWVDEGCQVVFGGGGGVFAVGWVGEGYQEVGRVIAPGGLLGGGSIISLNANRLTDLPAEVCKLTGLQRLSLHINQVMT